MGFFFNKRGTQISDYFKLLDSIGNYMSGNMYDVSLYDDHLEISSPLQKNKIILNYHQITDVFYGSQVELKAVKKSVIGRAITGGVLFGGIGAIVGSISGVGSKEKTERRFYFVISYTSSDGNDSFLQFEDTRLYKGRMLADMLKQYVGIPDVSESDIRL